jgi:hypothetical protein
MRRPRDSSGSESGVVRHSLEQQVFDQLAALLADDSPVNADARAMLEQVFSDFAASERGELLGVVKHAMRNRL